jgi:Ca2+-binding RTX toxin-like protein
MPFYAGTATDAKLSSDGSKLFVVTGSQVQVVNTTTGQVIASYELGHTLGAFDLSADERYLVVVAPVGASPTHVLFDRIDLQTGTIQNFSIPVNASLVSSFFDVAYLSDGRVLFSQTGAFALTQFDFATGTASYVLGADRRGTFVTDADRTTTYILGNTIFWHTAIFETGVGVTTNRMDNPDPYAGASVPPPLAPIGAISADGSIVVQGNTLVVRNASLATVVALDALFSQARGLAFSPAGDRLYLVNSEGQIVAYQTSNWQPVAIFDGGGIPISQEGFGDVLDISANGQTLSIMTANGVQLIAVASMVPYATNGDDVIVRNGTLIGLGGNDYLDSLNGYSMFGGPGNDTYIVRNSNYLTERPGEGYDTARVGISGFWSMPENFEEAVVTTALGSYILGSNGNDRITGNSGVDRFYAASGNDLLFGLDGDDILLGDHGDDTIEGGNGADVLIGGDGADIIIGGDGNDVLASAASNYFQIEGADDLDAETDNLNGGNGDDSIWIGAGDSADGGSGFDRLNLSLFGASAGLNIDTASLLSAAPYALAGGTIVNFEVLARLRTTNFADDVVISANHGAIAVETGGGNDLIRFTAVSTTVPAPTEFGRIDGGADLDTLDLSAIGPVTIGTLSPSAGQFSFGAYIGSQGYLLSEIETILLGAADNYVDMSRASSGVSLYAGAGNDSFVMAGGTSGYGEAGDDIFSISITLYDQGFVDGGSGTNTLQTNILSTVNLATGTVSRSGYDFYLISNIQNVQLAATNGYRSTAIGDDAANILSVNPLFDDGSVGVTLNGGGGNDELRGSIGNDMLDGGTGANMVFGRAGNDRLILGAGAEGSTLDGGTGTDTVVVSGDVASLANLTGVEAMEFAGGSILTLTSTQFRTGLASNTAVSGTGTLTINMDAPGIFLNKLFAFNGTGVSVIVNGTSGTDVIKVGNARHTINTGDGGNIVQGGNQVDTVTGGTGIDKIAGNGGADVLTGGAGNDVFKYRNANDSGLGAAADRITDFTIGSDRLNFVKLDANASLAGDQAFSFVGTAAFSNSGVGQVRYANSGADLLVQADVNGDGIADMEIILQGRAGSTLTAADFVL